MAYRNGTGAAAAEPVSEAQDIVPASGAGRIRPKNATPGASGSTVSAKSSLEHVPGPDPTRSESHEDYATVVARLDSKTRVIECANGIQWIVQRRRGRTWQGVYFCRTKAGLLIYARPITPELLALPEYFERRSKDDWLDWPPHEGAS